MAITKQTYSEVYAILNLMSWNLLNKIPDKILENIDNKRDKEQVIEVHNIKDYQLSEEANKLLAVIYKNYFANEEEQKVIEAKEKILYQKEQEELYKKYNQDNLFKNKVSKVEKVENSIAMIEYKESIFIKLKNWFKRTL